MRRIRDEIDAASRSSSPSSCLSVSRPLARRLVAEAIGTFALVFAGCGAIMVDAKTHALGHVGVAFTFGLVIMAMIYAVGHISGAHFNGAVTLAFALTRHFPWPRAFALLGGAARRRARWRRRSCAASLGDVADVGATLPSGTRPPVVPLGDRADGDPDVRDHGRRHRHAGRR